MSGKECYFMIESSADGISVQQYTQEALEEYLLGEEYCTENWIENNVHFLEALTRTDPQEWSMGKYATALIIKGEIIVPKPAEIVTKYKL